MTAYYNKYDNERPFTNHPIFTVEMDPDPNQLWVDAAWACEAHASEHGTSDMDPEEICLAVSATMAGEIDNGGTRQWLLWNMHRPDLAAHAVQSLRFMGSHGMAGFIERIIDAYLGPRELWIGLTPSAWKKYQERRDKILEQRSRYAVGVTAKTNLGNIGMAREEFFAFCFDSSRKLAETGDIAEYQRWYDKHALTTPDPKKTKSIWSILHPIYTRFAKVPPPGKPVLATSLYVDIGSIKGGMSCFPYANPHDAGPEGYWYWGNEFDAMCYEFTVNNIGKVRESLRKQQD